MLAPSRQPEPDVSQATADLLAEVLHPALRHAATYTLTRATGSTVEGTDVPHLLRSSLESARVQQAFTVLVSAQATSNGLTQRELAAALGFSTAGNFAKDQLWSQMTTVAATLTAAREQGHSTVDSITIRVPTGRQVFQNYVFHNVPTSL